ncbi:MAG: protein-export chaperone SecB [Candidatus Wallbacteria bacterium]|nr:protein-export chaperone SecB [Candidatus Wallbacteria bacterium]
MNQNGDALKFLGYKVDRLEFRTDDRLFTVQKHELTMEMKVKNTEIDKEKKINEVLMELNVRTSDGAFIGYLQIRGGFQLPASVEGSAGRTMAVEAPGILYPYARALMNGSLALAGIPLPGLPVVAFSGQEAPQNLLGQETIEETAKKKRTVH